MGLQQAGLGERRAVHAAQHGLAGIAAPVGAGGAGQLDGADGAGAHQMRPGAEVGKVALTEERQLFALACVLFQQLQLIRLVFFQHAGFVCRQQKLLDGFVFFDDLFHFGLNFFKVFGRKRGGNVEIVIKTAVDGRPDGQLGLREQMPHGLCQHVAGRMPKRLFAVFIVKGQNFKVAVLLQRGAQVDDLAVYLAAGGSLVQPGAQRFCNLCNRGALLKLFDNIVF
ncbi:hypothetical protein SDC9_139996 [bioreactor metagenome]|uniref:Uncharacterized protein n=1 Tax=bioreactor metagenome TaxID=1076179 RepID=A0A645DTP5_9ZZZZ